MTTSRLISHPTVAVVLAVVLCGSACNGDIAQLEELPRANPAGADANAGNWRMVVLSGPTQVLVAPPAEVTSDAYRAELAAIQAGQANLSDAQRQAIEYWSAGGVLRWNQILRELVARYDLAPAPRDNGTYVFPDADNPFADPQFPFSNPPYAARAYSYVSLAQFEALKVAWYYKFQYNRPSPAAIERGIQSLMPSSGVPAYPSEDAVLSGVSTELLRLLFPAAVEDITRRAAQQREAALLSGRASASDIAAGLAIGRAVAAVFMARAGADGTRNATGSAPQWQALAASASARGEIPWMSQDVPPRPPLLPFFGQVRAWMMTPADVVKERPAPPPSTSSQQMRQELAEVKNAVDNLTREQLAIVYKWADGASTYTPPGHWNDIAVEYVAQARFSEVRAARVFALLNMALHDAAVACWDAKYTYFNPRPSQLDRRIRTVIALPNFPSYTSGHSTFSAAAALVLGYLFPSGASYFDEERDEAAISRLYGGIHYRTDIEVGVQHGQRVGSYTLEFARRDGAD